MSAHEMNVPKVSCGACRSEFSDSALFCPNCGSPKLRATGVDGLVGKVLGERFLVQEQISHGASGTIFRGEHVTLRRRVAVKVLHADLSRDELAVERFRREATSVGEIDNEHIVEILDFGRTPDGRLYFAMEFLEGESLDATIVREHQLSVELTTDLLIQVGEALMEAHAIGYVHRDIRPRNIFLAHRRGRSNFVKLLDFGLAKLVETDSQAASTALGMTFGDPRYMSPEQARGDRIDRRADIYQLGCVAYEMLAGRPPFVGNRVFDILSRQVSEAPTPLPVLRPGVPLWLEFAVARMLAKSPEDRFATTPRMVEALRIGQATGSIMEDGVARRTETIPPPSVSREMLRAGVLPTSTPVPAPMAPATVTTAPRELTPRVLPAPVVTSPTPIAPAVAAVLAGVAADAAAPLPSGSDPSSFSGAWFADGESDLNESRPILLSRSSSSGGQPARRFSRRPDRSSASMDGLYSSSLDLGVAGGAGTRRGPRWVLLAAGALAVGGALIWVWPSGGGESPPPPAPLPQVQGAIVDGGLAVLIDAAAAVSPPSTTTAGSSGGSGTRRSAGPALPPPRLAPGPTGGDDPLLRYASTHPDAAVERVVRPTRIDAGIGTTTTVLGDPSGSAPMDPYAGGELGQGGSDPVEPYGSRPADAQPVSPDELVAQGYQALRSGNLGAAAAAFKRALDHDGNHLDASLGLIELAMVQRQYPEAVVQLKRVVKLAPESVRVHILLGEAHLNSGRPEPAMASFKRALQLDPDSARARDGFNEASSRVPPPTDDR
jgi:serine/threonine protein kinase